MGAFPAKGAECRCLKHLHHPSWKWSSVFSRCKKIVLIGKILKEFEFKKQTGNKVLFVESSGNKSKSLKNVPPAKDSLQIMGMWCASELTKFLPQVSQAFMLCKIDPESSAWRFLEAASLDALGA